MATCRDKSKGNLDEEPKYVTDLGAESGSGGGGRGGSRCDGDE